MEEKAVENVDSVEAVVIEDKRKQSKTSKFKQSEIFKRLKSVKNLQFIACVFMLAVAMLVYAGVTDSIKVKNNATAPVSSTYIMTDAEKKLSSFLEQIEGAGNVNVLINYINDNKEDGIASVIVVADGANNIAVKLDIFDAVRTALDVDADLVCVYKKIKN